MPIGWTTRQHMDGNLSRRCVDREIAAVAERQHGVVSRLQLREIGLGRGAIDFRVARHRLHQVHFCVYAVGHTNLTPAGRSMAGVLSGGARAVLSHRSAAAHWGIRPTRDGPIEVTTAARRRSGFALRYYRNVLPADEVTTHDGIPVTTVPRTLFDLAAVIPRPHLRRAVREAEIRRLWDRLSIADLLERHPRRPGAAAIRTVTDPGARFTRSELEDLFLDLVDSTGLPRPATNVWLHIAGRWIEADCAWPHQRLIVELDGRATHDTDTAFESDRARDRAATAAGWRVIRITWRQLRDEPSTIARDLRAALTLEPVANLRQA
jgi:hypothetical protein